jgi:DNA-binding Lrp family transcriptional regulator
MGTVRSLSNSLLKLLIAVQEEPLATVEQLSKRTGISKPTVAKKMRILEGIKSSERIRDHPEGRYFTIAPIIDNPAIGLEYYGVVVETSSIRNMMKLEKLGDEHPYTQYRIRCFGRNNGVFFQFRIPFGTKPLLEELLEDLKNRGVLTNATPLPPEQSPPVYTNLSVSGWDGSKMGWEFNWDEWFEFQKSDRGATKTPRKPGLALDWLTKRDVHIIHEVMQGARRKNLEIIQALNDKGVAYTPQTFSRRYKMIQKDCFEGYRANFDPTVFDIYNSVIIMGEGTKSYLQKLKAKLISEPIPFQTTLRVSENHLFWYLRLQSIHLSKVISNLYRDLKNMSIWNADYASSMSYYVWPEAFDDGERKWRTDHDFLVGNFLK